jgi:hypothetical protein
MFRARGVDPVAWPLLVVTRLPRLPAETKQPPDGQEIVVDETALSLVEHYSTEKGRALRERTDGSPTVRFAACRDNPNGGSREAAQKSTEGFLIDTTIRVGEEQQGRGTVGNTE